MTRYMWFTDDEMMVRRVGNNPKLERYDPKTKEWIPDWSLSEVFTGDVRFMAMEEDEAWKKLESLK